MSGPMDNNAELQCPECGYDLRATQTGRCPECGAAFDRESLSRSKIAWEHRKEIGRLRAWWRTIWQATFRIRNLTDSINAPLDWHAARRFWLINSLLLYMPILIGLLFQGDGLRMQAELAARGGEMLPSQVWRLNLIVPLAMGYALPGMIFVTPLFLLTTAIGMQTYLLQAAAMPRELQNRAAALGLYLSGAFVGGAILTVLAVALIVALLLPRAGGDILLVPLAISPLLLLAVAWSSTWRVYRRLTRASGLRLLAFDIAVPICWLLCTFLWTAAFPWCVGLFALIIGSMFF